MNSAKYLANFLTVPFEIFGFFMAPIPPPIGPPIFTGWRFHALLSHYAAPFAVVADIFCRSSSESWEAAIS